MSNTRTIARNTGWYGLETVISAVVTLFTSIGIARALGPTRMGYMIFVMWLAWVISGLGALGIPYATSKYMAEYIGRGERHIARYIYFRTLLLQMALATLSTIGLLIWTMWDAEADYRLAAAMVVISTWPGMVNAISSQANVATEELWTNLPASIISTLVYFFAIAATVVLHWGVNGVGAAFLVMRTVDFLVRFFPTLKRVRSWPNDHLPPPDLRRRMIAFAWQSVATLVVSMIVWNRSEVVLLKYLCADIRQVAFYSVAFSMADRLLISSGVFGAAISTTIFVQYGRDRTKIASISALSFRYLAMTAIPLHFIAAALAYPALLLLYGSKYAGAAMVVSLAPLLCLPKAFIGPVNSLVQSVEKQVYVIAATVIAGLVDVGVACLLIPRYGAVGACIGSGAAQVVALSIMWSVGIRLYHVRLPWKSLAKIVFASTVAALAAHSIAVRMTPLGAVLFGGTSAVSIAFLLFYLLRIVEAEDTARFKIMTATLPGKWAQRADLIFGLLVRPENPPAQPAKNLELRP